MTKRDVIMLPRNLGHKIGSSHDLGKLRIRREMRGEALGLQAFCFPVIYLTLYNTGFPISPTLGSGICDGPRRLVPPMSPLGDISTS